VQLVELRGLCLEVLHLGGREEDVLGVGIQFGNPGPSVRSAAAEDDMCGTMYNLMLLLTGIPVENDSPGVPHQFSVLFAGSLLIGAPQHLLYDQPTHGVTYNQEQCR
jgi:hypothetical protein